MLKVATRSDLQGFYRNGTTLSNALQKAADKGIKVIALRPVDQGLEERRLLRHLRQLPGRSAAGAVDRKGAETQGREGSVQHRAVRRLARRQQRVLLLRRRDVGAQASQRRRWQLEGSADQQRLLQGKPGQAGQDSAQLQRMHVDTILEVRGITKTFPGVTAVDNVHLAVRAGEIHAVVTIWASASSSWSRLPRRCPRT